MPVALSPWGCDYRLHKVCRCIEALQPGLLIEVTSSARKIAEYAADEAWSLATLVTQSWLRKTGGGASDRNARSARTLREAGRSAALCLAEMESVVQINGVGPFDVIYVDPKDDPRKK